MKSLKSFIIQQLSQIDYDDVLITETSDAVVLTTSVNFKYVHVTVHKGNANAGWTRKNSSKNAYSMNFEITQMDNDKLSINVYSQGLLAQCILVCKNEYWDWEIPNPCWELTYPFINFTNSLNRRNTLTEFIAEWVVVIKNCLNAELTTSTKDETTYDSEPPNGTVPEGDLILTIREDTWKELSKTRYLKLPSGIVKIDKTMLGKQVVLRDKEPGVFYPLNIEDFNIIKEEIKHESK